MKTTRIAAWLLAGIFIGVFLSGTWIQAYDFSRYIKVWQYPVQFFIEGKLKKPQNTTTPGTFRNGNKEVPLSLIYEGTTYVPIRFIGESLGKEVGWDGNSYTVWVGEKPAQLQSQSSTVTGSEKDKTQQSAEHKYSLYGVKLGDSSSQVLAVLGEPQRKDPSHIGVTWWIYKTNLERYIQVGIQNDRVVTLYSNGSGWNFDGIGMGMTPQTIQAKWGAPLSSIQVTDDVSIRGNAFNEHVLYKKGEQMVMLYLDLYQQNQVRGIRISAPDLFVKTIPAGYSYQYYESAELSLPSLTEDQLRQVETAYEKQVWDLTNVIRNRAGLPLLEYNDQVAQIARSHSLDMYQNQFFDHRSPTTGEPGDRLRNSSLPLGSFSENIAAGYLDGIDAMEGWMNSKGHRDNILNHFADQMGVGIVLKENQMFRNYFTQNFYAEY